MVNRIIGEMEKRRNRQAEILEDTLNLVFLSFDGTW